MALQDNFMSISCTLQNFAECSMLSGYHSHTVSSITENLPEYSMLSMYRSRTASSILKVGQNVVRQPGTAASLIQTVDLDMLHFACYTLT